MTTLIIYAHPKVKGHNELILKKVKSKLKEREEKHEVIDLYKINYNPVLLENEHYPSGGREISTQNKRFQTKIKNADRLVVIYPLWWGSMPAILKGFFDRILTPGFGYYFKKNGLPHKLLRGKKSAVFMTSGSPTVYNQLLLNRFTVGISKDILNFCGIENKVFQIDRVTRLTDSQKLKIEKKVDKGLSYLY